MNTNKHEYLSAVIDGEAGKFEQRRILDELKKDTDLQSTFSHYALIGEVMREGDPSVVIKPDFLASVQNRLLVEDQQESANDSASGNMSQVTHSRWFRPFAGFAVASVAAVISVVALNIFNQPDMLNTQASLNRSTDNIAAATPMTTPLASTETQAADYYGSRHLQHASMRYTIAPTPQVITYTANQNQ